MKIQPAEAGSAPAGGVQPGPNKRPDHNGCWIVEWFGNCSPGRTREYSSDAVVDVHRGYMHKPASLHPVPCRYVGIDVFGPRRHLIGRVLAAYGYHNVGAPSWVIVDTGRLMTNEFLVPLHRSKWSDLKLQLLIDRNVIECAPDFDDPTHLSAVESRELVGHYRLFFDDDAFTPPLHAGRLVLVRRE